MLEGRGEGEEGVARLSLRALAVAVEGRQERCEWVVGHGDLLGGVVGSVAGKSVAVADAASDVVVELLRPQAAEAIIRRAVGKQSRD